MAIGEAVSALAAVFCVRFKTHLKWLAVSLCYFRSGLFLLSPYLLMSQFFCYKLLKAEMPKDVRKKLVVQLGEALLICQGEKLLLGYKLLSCSLCKMGFSSSPAEAPPLPCWQRTGLALKLLWPWFARVWWWLCGLRRGSSPSPACVATVVALCPDKDPGVTECCSIRSSALPRGCALPVAGAAGLLRGWEDGEQVFGCSLCRQGAVHRQGGDQVLEHSLPARDKSYVRLQHPQRRSMWRAGKQRGKLRGR